METLCFRVFILLNYMKAHVSMYFLHLMLTFFPRNDVMVNGPLHGGIILMSVGDIVCQFLPVSCLGHIIIPAVVMS